MKIIYKTEVLLEKLKNIAPTAEAKQTLIILGNIKFDITDNNSTLIASDLEIEVSTEVECKAEGSDSFTLPAKKFLEVCSALSQHESITIDINGNKANIIAGRSKVMLSTLPSDDYPRMTLNNEISKISTSAKNLKLLFEKTAFAMAYQDARHFLNGIHICVRNGKLVSVSTDGHRLSMYSSNIPCEVADLSLILPRKCIQELSRIIASFNDNTEIMAEITVFSNLINVDVSGYKIISKLIEGNYPDFEKVIPENTKFILSVEKTTLKNSLNIISKVVNQQYKGVKFTPSKESLHLISSNTDSEIGEDSIPATYDGEELSIGFNISYVQDVIDSIGGNQVVIKINDQNSGCVLNDPEAPESVHVIMPMRV